METNKILITEGLDFHDMEGQVEPKLSVDEYSAKMGDDKDIITLSFVVKSDLVGEDLVDWFERGYDWVLDASVSDGEIEVGKWLVFVEMDRRSSAPKRIIELLKDLKTLTNLKIKDWTVSVYDEDYDADESILSQVIVLNPNKYKLEKENEEEINEMRELANLETVNVYKEQDQDIKNFKTIAGI